MKFIKYEGMRTGFTFVDTAEDFLEAGKQQISSQIEFCMQNASRIKNTLKECGFEVFGDEKAPYIWWQLPQGVKSIEFFDILLENDQVVGIPGVSSYGEKYFCLTTFGSRENTCATLERIKDFSLNKLPILEVKRCSK